MGKLDRFRKKKVVENTTKAIAPLHIGALDFRGDPWPELDKLIDKPIPVADPSKGPDYIDKYVTLVKLTYGIDVIFGEAKHSKVTEHYAELRKLNPETKQKDFLAYAQGGPTKAAVLYQALKRMVEIRRRRLESGKDR